MSTKSELRAVVADDAKVTRRLVGQYLTTLGIHVVSYATSGVEAVRQCLQQTPDLLFLDLVMPQLSGVDVIRLVRPRLPVRIVVITSHCDKSLHARCLAIGASHVLIKPVSIDELRQVLR